ncbi:MAG: HDOD domain-containing protein [Parasulfuritortus sp.]|nr:HDOD domain-containing protein [Parasulfuritortus sp.]
MAALTLEHWLTRLKPGETPVFRHTKEALMKLAPRGEQLSAKEIAAPILADPLATLRVIFNANNRTNSRYNAEVTTVEHAILMQGVNVFLDKARDLPVMESTPQGRDKDILGSLYRLARLAQHAAWQARDFATLHHDMHADELQMGAVLYYAPEFLLWLDAPDIADQLAQLRRNMLSAEAEQNVLGFAMPPLRLMLLEAWKIPDGIRDLLDEKHADRARQIILKAALKISHRSRQGWWDTRLLESYQALSETIGLSMDDVIRTVHDNAIRVARTNNWVPAPPAAAWLPMQEGEWPQDSQRKSSPAIATPENKAADDEPHTVCPMPVKSVLDETIATLRSHQDDSLSLSQMLAIILKGLHSGLGLSRVLFALATPDGVRMKCRFTLGIPSGDPLRHFEFSLNSNDLFGLITRKMQGVWVNDENRGKLWPMVGPDLRAMIGRGDFYAMSLFANDRPIGLIYADRGHGDCELDSKTYNDFKVLCLEAAKGLSRVKSQ